MRGLFVTATDTAVGKTEVTCALLRGHRARGLDVVAMKPAQSGQEPGEQTDSEKLTVAAGGVEPQSVVGLYSFSAPLAPAVAARLEGKQISLEAIVEGARALAARHAALLVEGAGGLLTPLTESSTYADLAIALRLPALVVARAGLGTVNHTALTCEALKARGVAIHGVVLNRLSERGDPSESYNASEIERLTGVPVLASLPFVPERQDRERQLATTLSAKVQF